METDLQVLPTPSLPGPCLLVVAFKSLITGVLLPELPSNTEYGKKHTCTHIQVFLSV